MGRETDMAGELPQQLSFQQRYILAYLSSAEAGTVPFKAVSEATALELDDDGNRLARRGEASHRLTSRHTSSFSRAVDSLEDRGLVEADRGSGPDRPRRVALRLTPAGRAAAEELRRRHRDGRFALEFETLEVD